MNINKILKTALIGGGVYALTNLCYYLGKGQVIRLMREYDMSADEILEIVKANTKSGPVKDRVIFNIIECAATLETK